MIWQCKVSIILQFVKNKKQTKKNAMSVRCNKARCKKPIYACIVTPTMFYLVLAYYKFLHILTFNVYIPLYLYFGGFLVGSIQLGLIFWSTDNLLIVQSDYWYINSWVNTYHTLLLLSGCCPCSLLLFLSFTLFLPFVLLIDNYDLIFSFLSILITLFSYV